MILEAARHCVEDGCDECPLNKPFLCIGDPYDFAEAILKQNEKYGWHDIVKNPNDMPVIEDGNKLYLIYYEYSNPEYRIVRGWWIKERIEENKKFADAWKEIEEKE